MEIGENIASLRKEKKLTQEELAEILEVSRQTISKWELNDTSPDLKQAKKIAEYFEVSLDALAGFDINNIITKKISNIERLAGITIKILKVLGVTIYLFILGSIIYLGFHFYNKKDFTSEYQSEFECTTSDNETYNFYIEQDEDNNFYIVESVLNSDGLYEITNKYNAGTSFLDLSETIKIIKKLAIDNGSVCR